jgi:chromosome segregation ATPase
MIDAAHVDAVRATMEADLATKQKYMEHLEEQLGAARDEIEAMHAAGGAPAAAGPVLDSGSPTPPAGRASGGGAAATASQNNSFTSADAARLAAVGLSPSGPRARRGSVAVTTPRIGRLQLSGPSMGGAGRDEAMGAPMYTARGHATARAIRTDFVPQLEAENANLRARVEQLEEELRVAIDALQAHVGDDAAAAAEDVLEGRVPLPTDITAIHGEDAEAEHRAPDPDELLEIQALEAENVELEARVVALTQANEALTAQLAGTAGVPPPTTGGEETMAALADAYEKLAAAEQRVDALEEAERTNVERIALLDAQADELRETLSRAKAEAEKANREAGAQRQEREAALRRAAQLELEIDDIRSDAQKAADAAAAHITKTSTELAAMREAIRRSVDEGDQSADDIRALQRKVASLERELGDSKKATAEAIAAATIRANMAADEATATAEEKANETILPLEEEVKALREASQQAGSAIKMAELQSKLAVATRQVAQHREEWAAAAARHKDAEQRLLAAHEQHTNNVRAVAAERDQVEARCHAAAEERDRAAAQVTELRAKVAALEGELDVARAAGSDILIKSVGNRNHNAVERLSAVMNEHHEAMMGHLQNAVFAARAGAADARTMRVEREALIAAIKATRSKYTALQAHTAQLCGHIAECHAIMRTQKEDLTQRLTAHDVFDGKVAKDLAAMMAERDDALHVKDQLLIDMAVELDQAREGGSDAAHDHPTGPTTGRRHADPTTARGMPLASPRTGTAGAANSTTIGFLEGAQYREHMQTLERSLRRRVDEANRATAKYEILRAQLERLGQPLDTTTRLAEILESAAGAPKFTREQLAAETSIDTAELQILIDCKEAELRVIS